MDRFQLGKEKVGTSIIEAIDKYNWRDNNKIELIDNAIIVTKNTQWIDEIFDPVFEKIKISRERYEVFYTLLEIEQITNIQWATLLSKPFGMMPHKLFVYHAAIVKGIN